jgi:LmbE family N-acetylglucosaminyl deacetylase
VEEFHYINHPDHRAVAESALYAIFPSAETRPIFPELLAEGLEPYHVSEVWMMLTNKPNQYVDISAVHERKIKSVMCHRSQLGEEVPAFVEHFDAESGKHIGVEYAEEFRVMRFYQDQPPVGDAVS